LRSYGWRPLENVHRKGPGWDCTIDHQWQEKWSHDGSPLQGESEKYTSPAGPNGMNNEKSKSSLQQHVSHKIIPYREISWVKWTKDSFVWNTRLIARSEDQGLNVSIVKAHPMLRHKSRWDVKESEHLGSRGHVSATPPELDVNNFGIYTRHSNFYRENDDELRYIYITSKSMFFWVGSDSVPWGSDR